jgi:hypothetical protein
MKTVQATAWIMSPEYMNESDASDPHQMFYTDISVEMGGEGWLKVGTAEINFTSSLDRRELVSSMVETQNSKIKKIQANAENEITKIKRKITELQAITFDSN